VTKQSVVLLVGTRPAATWRGGVRMILRIGYIHGYEPMMLALAILRSCEEGLMGLGVGPIALLSSGVPHLGGMTLADDGETALFASMSEVLASLPAPNVALALARGGAPLTANQFPEAASDLPRDLFAVETWDDIGTAEISNEFTRLRHGLDIALRKEQADDGRGVVAGIVRRFGLECVVQESVLPNDIRSLS
jgi:hypothetical protein